MLEIIQDVSDDNIDTIFARYQTLGWGQRRRIGRNEHLIGLQLVWPYECAPQYPDLSDLPGPHQAHIL